MKVLVTGGAGFIGSHIVDKLIENNYKVIVLDNLSNGFKEYINPSAQFVKMDIRSSDISELFIAEDIDFVVHHAAQVLVASSIDNPYFDADVNIMGTLNLLEASRKSNIKRFVFASSAAVYGDCSTLPITEDAAKQPQSFYGLSKLTIENYLELYRQTYGLNYTVLRYANVFGERQGDSGEGGVVSIFCRKLQQGQLPLSVYGDGDQTRDFIYAGDVANANVAALTSQNFNKVYNISTGKETSVNQLADILSRVAGITADKTYFQPREGDIQRSVLANQRAIGQLGWRPMLELEEGLRRTYQSLGKHDR